MNPGEKHLDLLEIDALRAGEGTPLQRSHLERCEACRAELAALSALAAQVRARAAPAFGIPEEVDRAILATARKTLPASGPAAEPASARATGRPKILRFPLSVRVAAAVLLALGLGLYLARDWFGGRPPEVARRQAATRPVDIVDAYALALRIHSGEKLTPDLDSNGDGTVDLRDVDDLARRSVSISGVGRP